MLDTSHERKIEGQRFDQPLMLIGGIENEPEQYIAEKPYELTKYEFSVFRRPSFSEFWFNISAGATAGIAISILGKIIQSILNYHEPSLNSLEKWEVFSFIIGVGLSICFKFFFKSKDEKEKEVLDSLINQHFIDNKLRKVHAIKGEYKNEVK